MSKKTIIVELTVKLHIEVSEDVSVSEVIQEMDYDFSSNTKYAKIIETEILDEFEVEV